MKKDTLYLIGIPIVVLFLLYLLFGSLNPCEAMRLEVRRVAEKESGFLGNAILSTIADIKTDDYGPVRCATTAFRLKVGGKEALQELILGEHDKSDDD